ncbi:MAG: hypothetical protein OXC95_07815 [Dehalococcoidia bacterium]|nr:hypothetical protein [Dehalococcoidia bacterium]
MTYNEPECLQCGFVDYKYVSPTPISAKNLMSSATRFVFRYIGESPNLKETLVDVQLRRIRNRVVYAVTCPFCQSQMDQSSLSGKRREIREERYKCTQGHRVSLIPRKSGSMGWK